MQVTRGVAERDFAFPRDAAPTVVMFTQAKTIALAAGRDRNRRRHRAGPALEAPRHQVGVAPAAVLEARRRGRGSPKPGWWGRLCDRGSSSTAFIITADRRIMTRPLSAAVPASRADR